MKQPSGLTPRFARFEARSLAWLRYSKPARIAGIVLTYLASNARADEPRKVNEPKIMRDPAEITNVVDAFDDDDPFDLHLSLGFEQSWKNGSIRRETSSSQPQLSSGGFTATHLEVAKYSESTSRLNTRADIGIYKDIALVLRVPVILSNDRELKATGSSGANQAFNLQGAPGEQLFGLPFRSPTRSGIEYLAVGLDFGILNQWRDATKPSWVFGFEGRFNVGEPMHACNSSPASNQVRCADPSDIDRDGVASVAGQTDQFTTTVSGHDTELQGTHFKGSRQPGVSRGTTALEVHTYLSKRIKYIEPYGGMNALFEFQNDSSDFGATDLKGSRVNHPPLQGSMVLGMEVTPWEMLDRSQRLAIDLRFTGTYHSEGRDYSEIYDALGSSASRSLRYPTFAQFQANPDAAMPGAPESVVNPSSERVYTTGITDVQPYGTFMFSAGVTWQAGEYIKFNVGGSYTLIQEHVLTFDQPCNPDFTGDSGAAGPCRTTTGGSGTTASGIPNPNYRAVIDTPGRRFRVADEAAFDTWVNATVMF